MNYSIFSEGSMPLLGIDSVGYSDDTAVTRFGPGRRSLYIIHYVIDGRGYYNGNEVAGGQGFLITPQQLEEYHPDKNDPWKFLWIISSDNAMENIFKYYRADTKTKIFNYDFIPIVKSTAEKICINSGLILSQSEILEIFLHIFNYHFTATSRSEISSSRMYVNVAIKYIQINYHTYITVHELTKLLGISQPYLYKIFIKHEGKSPKQYIDDFKISKAKELLNETDMTIEQISESVGYENYQTFSKRFSSDVKLSPQYYRNSVRSQKR